MDTAKLISAIASNDFVKVKQCFNEAMELKIANVLAEERLVVAASVLVEGESPKDDDTDDDNDDNDDDEKPGKGDK